MYKFSKRSQSNLIECHVDLQKIALTAIAYIDFAVIEGYRGREAQNKAYFSGHSQLIYPDSKHNQTPSMAFDIIPYESGRFTGWDNHKSFYFLAGHMAMIAKYLYKSGEISHRLRWGGDWQSDMDLSNSSFVDLPHYELVT